MHYDFRVKMNRIDSAQYRDLKIPEIDRKLNEAINLFLLLVAEPRIRNQFGFETTQRNIDDIRTMVVNEFLLSGGNATSGETVFSIPGDYLYYLGGSVTASKDGCLKQKMDVIVTKHDDRALVREFYESDFDWREVNIGFAGDGIHVYHQDFHIDTFSIDYIMAHPYVHYAAGFEGGTYTLPNGTVLGPTPGFQDCLLPDIVQPEVVDLAVLLATGDLELPMANQLRAGQLRVKQLV